MKSKLVITIIYVIFNLIGLKIFAQVSTEEKPVSSYLNMKVQIPTITMPPVDTTALINEDKIRSKDNTPKPYNIDFYNNIDEVSNANT